MTTTDRAAFLSDVAALVQCESPTEDVVACRQALNLVVDMWARHTGGQPDIVTTNGRPHALLRPSGDVRVLVLGHVDTVWPAGTLERWPFVVDGDHATGPGVYDMKAGLVMAVHAAAALDDPAGIGMLVTTDEETGSRTSQRLIEDVARGCDAVVVLEPSGPGGAVKHARKGVSLYRARVTGRAAHAGLEPHKGINALVAMAELVLMIDGIADPDRGTTVTPTVATAGTTMNTVPAQAMFRIDVRTSVTEELARVDAALAALQPALPGASVEIDNLGTRPPLEAAMSRDLLLRHEAICRRLGVGLPPPMASGGGSDGNFTAAAGIPTLDGLGAVGDGAHAEGEHITITASLRSAEVLTALMADLMHG